MIQESVRNESTKEKAIELGLIIQGTTISADMQPKLLSQSPFTRFDNNQTNYKTGQIGQAPSTTAGMQGAPLIADPSTESVGGGRRRTPGNRQTCCMKLGKKSRRKLTVDKENSKSGGPATGLTQRSLIPVNSSFAGISMKQRF